MPDRHTTLALPLLFALTFLASACPTSNETSCTTGTADCPCYANQTCNTDLSCVDGTCVSATSDRDSGPDDSTPDPDSRTTPDSTPDTASDTCTCVTNNTCCTGCQPKRTRLDCDSDNHDSASICRAGNCQRYATPTRIERDSSMFDIAVSDDGSRWATLPTDDDVKIHRSSDNQLVAELSTIGDQNRRELTFVSRDTVAIGRNDDSGPAACADDLYPDSDYAIIEIWDVSTESQLNAWSYRCRIRHLDGAANKRLAGAPCLAMDQNENCSDERIMVWNANTGDVIQDLGSFAGYIHDVALSPSGDYVAAGGCLQHDRDPAASCPQGVARVWSVQTGQLLYESQLQRFDKALQDNAVEAVAFTPDNAQFGYTSYDIDTSPRQVDDIRPAVDLISTQSWNRTDRWWITPNHVDDWDAIPEQLHLFEQSFAATGRKSQLRLWDLQQQELIAQLHSRYIYEFWEFSPDGSLLVTGLQDTWTSRTAALWRFDSLTRPRN